MSPWKSPEFIRAEDVSDDPKVVVPSFVGAVLGILVVGAIILVLLKGLASV